MSVFKYLDLDTPEASSWWFSKYEAYSDLYGKASLPKVEKNWKIQIRVQSKDPPVYFGFSDVTLGGVLTNLWDEGLFSLTDRVFVQLIAPNGKKQQFLGSINSSRKWAVDMVKQGLHMT